VITPAPPAGLRIALMAKAPVAGQAKTRLAPALGAVGAAALAERLLAHALQQALQAAPGAVTLWVTPDLQHPAFARAAQQGVALAVQGPGDLGARMAQVFEAAWRQADGPVLLMGTDAPALDAASLHAAADALHQHAAAFVPAHDGGYVLVGLRSSAVAPTLLATLFAGMQWSTPRVMAHTRARLAAAGVAHAELPPVHDIDEPADLLHLPAGLVHPPERAPAP
jgi:uncharacterized protein